MPKRKSAPKPEYDFLSLEITDFSANVDASVNYEVRDPRHHDTTSRVFKFDSHLEISSRAIWPDERAGEQYDLTIYGHELHFGDFSMTLDDCHVEDETGARQYRRVGKKQVPVYDVPKGIGHIEKDRGSDTWSACVWVSGRSVSDMLKLLTNVRPLYVFIHERREGKNRWIVGLTVQTIDPASE